VLAAMIKFAAYSALRPGELFMLRPSRVRLAAKRIDVLTAWNAKTRKEDDTKNHLRREAVLFPEAREALQAIPAPLRDDFYFRNQRGGHLRPGSLHYYWRPVASAFGRPNMDFYELRHFCGTLMAEKGYPVADIAVQMGHDDNGETAMRYYIHVEKQRALKRIEERWDR
jgi:integrase